MAKNNPIIIGISVGDLNGIGPEIVLKSFADPRMLEFCTPVVFANIKFLTWYKKELGLECHLNALSDLSQVNHGKINVINAWSETFEAQYGKVDPKAGVLAIASLKKAVNALKNNQIDALVTAPIDKKNSQSEEFKFPGHTDYLAQELGGSALMFMVSEEVRVGLLTDHVPVKDAPARITKELIRQKASAMMASLTQDFGITRPKIAVLGVNPHSGDQGVIGSEDQEIMAPTINEMREEGALIYGPYPADGFFGSGQYKHFNAVLAAYHDQGLIPFKTLSFGAGVNFTAGLNAVRTSPDHGTAFDIAGKDQANISSFKEAIFTALNIVRQRKMHQKLTQAPLEISVKKPSHKKKHH